MKAYRLQDQGLDTVDANVTLGFAPDERTYEVGARMLSDLGVSKVRLLTNNPEKIEGLESEGIKVKERVPLVILPNIKNEKYLQVKAEKMGHLYNIKTS